MHKKTPHGPITDKVMAQIRKGELPMRPRAYFILVTSFVAVLSVIAGFLLAYVMSLVYFSLRILTADTMAYGARRNLTSAMADFPWLVAAVAVLMVGFAIWLVRRHSRLYRYHIVTLSLGFVAVSLLISVFFAWFGVGQPHGQSHEPIQTTQTELRTPGWRHNAD